MSRKFFSKIEAIFNGFACAKRYSNVDFICRARTTLALKRLIGSMHSFVYTIAVQ